MVVLVGASSVGIYAVRRSVLRAAGWALVISERVEPADVIVVVTDAEGTSLKLSLIDALTQGRVPLAVLEPIRLLRLTLPIPKPSSASDAPGLPPQWLPHIRAERERRIPSIAKAHENMTLHAAKPV